MRVLVWVPVWWTFFPGYLTGTQNVHTGSIRSVEADCNSHGINASSENNTLNGSTGKQMGVCGRGNFLVRFW
jgi:hypothetical protein